MVPELGPLQFVLEQIVLSDGRRVGDAVGADPWITTSMLQPVFAVDADGLPLNKLVYLELARGHWKSGGIAAVALAEAILHGSTDVVIAAADADQARVVFDNIAGYLDRNPALRASVKTRKDEFQIRAQRSRIRIISSDVPSSWGLGGTHRRFRVIADELTAWPQERGRELWTSLVSATGKVEDAQTIVLSNAGWDASRSWQWDVRETAKAQPWAHLFSASGVIATWVTRDWIERMRALLPPTAFDRLINNRWTSDHGDFVTKAQWARCVDLTRRPTAQGSGRHFAGLDLGLRRDRTALAVVHREGELVVLDDLQVWEGSRADPVSIAAVERAVLDLATRFPGLQLVADPWEMQGSIERLKGRLRVVEYRFSASSVGKLSSVLYNAITTARLRVYPDPELEAEILGLRVIPTASGWKFDHAVAGYSDQAVAVALALTEAVTVPGQVGVATSGYDDPDGIRSALLGDQSQLADQSGRLDPSLSYGSEF